MCHVLWMMPVLGLPLFWMFDFSVALSLYLGILALSGVVMVLTVASIRKPASSGIEAMHGEVAEVVEAIRRRGRVRHRNEYWYAESRDPIDVGDQVRIVGHRGLCLQVERLRPGSAAPAPSTPTCHVRAPRR